MTKKRNPNTVKRSDSQQHLPCTVEGCRGKRIAKGMCRYHWKNARLTAAGGPEARRNHYRKHNNSLPPATRPEPPHCECCGRELKPEGKFNEVPQLDHCHLTDIFRGWLCSRCNHAIGLLGDTIAGVEKAVAYLKRAYAK